MTDRRDDIMGGHGQARVSGVGDDAHPNLSARQHDPGCPAIADDESDQVLYDYGECVCSARDQPVDVRQLSAADLASYYQSLPAATAWPEGEFRGEAWSHDLPWVGPFSARVWQGKIFEVWLAGHVTAKNFIFRGRHIPGHVTLEAGEVVIDYPQLGLKDYLKPISATRWLGYMPLGTSTVWFMLDKW